jgi:hypothetical protein
MNPSLFASRKECSTLALVTVVALMPLSLIHARTDAPQGGVLYFVNTTSDTVVAGACANGLANCSLRGAIQVANSHVGADGIEVDLPAGSVVNLTGVLPDITESVSINGPGANLVTVRRNTGGNYRIFNVNTTGVVTLSGMTISNGLISSPSGGGVQNASGATVNITNCTVSGNSASGSGPIGGGLSNSGTGTMNVTNCTLSGNSATGGGWGGAIANSGGATVTVTNCTLSANSALTGGGIFNFNTMTVTNSTISGNSADGIIDGGGIFNNGAMAVKSSIIALNMGGNAPDVYENGTFTSGGLNLIGKNDGAAGSFPAGSPNANNDIVGTSASPINPKLDPAGLQNNGGSTQTIALLSDSPAIDKGTSNGLTGHLTTDQRGTGFPRTFDYHAVANAAGGDGTDIGAVELLAPFSVSRKMHGATNFDIDLPLTGAAGIECRSGGVNGDYQVIMTFATPVSLMSASVTTGTGSVSSFTVSGAQVTVSLTGVANAQTIVLTLFGASHGTNTPDVIDGTNDVNIPMGVLLGDTTGNGSVNSTDISLTKLKSGQAIDSSNFREDVTVSNSINSSDVSTVKLKSGTALP